MTHLETTVRHRRLALGGVIGPVAFVGAWSIGASFANRGFSPVDDAISQLAHVESNMRWLMTAGFCAFGIGVGLFAASARPTLGSAATWMLGATAASTVAVAALPLGVSTTVDGLHGLAAGLGYLTLIAAPLAALSPLRRHGAPGLARAGAMAAAVSATALAVSLTAGPTGLLQRVGLTAVDLWIIAVALLLVTDRASAEPPTTPSDERNRRIRSLRSSLSQVQPER
jgi:hypothetical membrane protein